MKKISRFIENIMAVMEGKWGSLAIMLITFASFSLIMSAAVTPEQVNLKVGDIATETITANKEIEDTVATEALREKAAADVEAIYNENTKVDEEVNKNILAAMELLLEKKAEIDGKIEDKAARQGEPRTDEPDAAEEADIGALLPDILDMAYLTQLEEAISPVVLAGEQWELIAATDSYVLQMAFERVKQAVRNEQNTGIREGYEDASLLHIEQELRTMLGAMGMGDDYVALCIDIIEPYFSANFIYDQEKTQALRNEAREAVTPVRKKIGQNIVIAGESVTAGQMAMLESLGMLESDIDWAMYFGLVVLVGVMLCALYCFMFLVDKQLVFDMHRQTLLSIIMVLALGSSVVVSQWVPNMAPFSISVLLITLLLNQYLGIIVNIVLGILVGVLLTSSGASTVSAYGLLVTSVVGSVTAVYVLRRRQTRLQVMLAGGAMAIANAIAVMAFSLINSANLYQTIRLGLYTACVGPISAIVCIGVQPVLEMLFHLITPSKLIELSNPNQPLLRRMLLEAPGTYHHSVIVANLAEAAADEIGANGLLARVGSYYHDVGKLRRPEYFKENQMATNPHDRLDPQISKDIIIAHPQDGVELAYEEKLPPQIVDIIASHHGTTLIAFFYAKAIEKFGEENVPEEEYRYPMPKPRGKEEAIVMMADTVEAACRAMKDPTRDKQKALIRKLVQQKIEDGQFDECDISLREIDQCCDAFAQALSGIYHERIEYPELKDKEEADALPAADAPENAEAPTEGAAE